MVRLAMAERACASRGAPARHGMNHARLPSARRDGPGIAARDRNLGDPPMTDGTHVVPARATRSWRATRAPFGTGSSETCAVAESSKAAIVIVASPLSVS